jgi:predicted transcriptional regulator
MRTKSERQEAFFKALASTHRIDILRMLRKEGACPVWYLSDKLGAPFQTISRHLKILHQAKLVEYDVHLNEHVYFLRDKQSLMTQYIIKKL